MSSGSILATQQGFLRNKKTPNKMKTIVNPPKIYGNDSEYNIYYKQ